MKDGNQLKKELTLLDVFCIATGAMISSGLFILPALAYAKTGPALFISYIVASFFAIPAMLSNAELVTAMPKAGGDYFFIARSMGLGVASIGGMASWFSLSLKSAFALIGMGAYVSLISNIPMSTVAVILCVFFVLLNILGIKEASFAQRFLVFGLLATILLYIVRGFPSVQLTRFEPFMPFGAASIFSTAGFVFISYGGLTKIASVAEEVKNPGRNIPLGMIFAIIVAGIFYALVVFVTIGVLEPGLLIKSLTPISDSANVFMGGFGVSIMALAAILAFVSTANAGIMSASRYPIAMARDKLLPGFFKTISAKFKTPHAAILVTGFFMIASILFLRLDTLVKVASTFLIILYAFANLAVIIMRESKIQNYQPKFRAPLYPWMQVLGMGASLFLLIEMGRETYLIIAIMAALSFFWYLIYARPRVKDEFALAHIIARVTAKEISSDYLEREFMEILRERDNIVEDRFDMLITKCEIIDLDRSIKMEDFFQIAADSLSRQMNINAKDVFNLLILREEESSTVIRPGLAIPHIIIEGDHKFGILLARCREGIIFPKTSGKVHAVFVLFGSKDERNFHLRALAAIAEIAQAKSFDKNWLGARAKEDLRNMVLTAERRRFHRK